MQHDVLLINWVIHAEDITWFRSCKDFKAISITSFQAANALMGDLDAIMPNCYSPSIIKMQTCVLKNLYTSRASLARLDNNAKDVMKTALFAYTTAISDARSCTTKLLANTRTFSVDITVRTSSCVRNAPPANGTTSTTASTTSSTTSSTTASV